MNRIYLDVNEVLDIVISPKFFTEENCKYVGKYCLDNNIKLDIEYKQVIAYLKEQNKEPQRSILSLTGIYHTARARITQWWSLKNKTKEIK